MQTVQENICICHSHIYPNHLIIMSTHMHISTGIFPTAMSPKSLLYKMLPFHSFFTFYLLYDLQSKNINNSYNWLNYSFMNSLQRNINIQITSTEVQ